MGRLNSKQNETNVFNIVFPLFCRIWNTRAAAKFEGLETHQYASRLISGGRVAVSRAPASNESLTRIHIRTLL